ncbi:MAG: hypothetical protein J6A65_10320, partial [Pseudomonas sp.]|nr:hypothetical protein [Pseudomonas sp.]
MESHLLFVNVKKNAIRHIDIRLSEQKKALLFGKPSGFFSRKRIVEIKTHKSIRCVRPEKLRLVAQIVLSSLYAWSINGTCRAKCAV